MELFRNFPSSRCVTRCHIKDVQGVGFRAQGLGCRASVACPRCVARCHVKEGHESAEKGVEVSLFVPRTVIKGPLFSVQGLGFRVQVLGFMGSGFTVFRPTNSDERSPMNVYECICISIIWEKKGVEFRFCSHGRCSKVHIHIYIYI